MSNRRLGRLFMLAVVGLYLVLTLPVLALLRVHSSPWWMLLAIPFECMSIALSLELVELLLAMLLPPHIHPRLPSVDRSRLRLAALYVCCDDVDEQSLQALCGLKDAEAFILDDSSLSSFRAQVDGSAVQLVRRDTRLGYKAGNLNNWLLRFGSDYDYFVILDSDSLMTEDAMWELAAFAEHPANRDVAIVQSQIYPRAGNRFQNAVSSTTAARMQVLSRLHDRIGWMLSHGHNNLHRTRALVQIGGFDTSSSCEDTLTSMKLYRWGWRIILAPTMTQDGEPSHPRAYRRRHVRWARQTVEAIMVTKGTVSLPLTLLMARHLLSYLMPFVCVVMLGLVAFLSPSMSVAEAWGVMARNYTLAPHHVWAGISSYLLLSAFLAASAARFRLALRSGVNTPAFVLSSLLGGALAAFSGLGTIAAMLQSFLGSQVKFHPTGADRAAPLSLVSILRDMALPWALYLAIAVRLCTNPGLLLFGCNLLWAAILVGSPLLLWLCYTDQGGGQHAVFAKGKGLYLVQQ